MHSKTFLFLGISILLLGVNRAYASADQQLGASQRTVSAASRDRIERFNNHLNLTQTQCADIDKIIEGRLGEIDTVRSNPSFTSSRKQAKVDELRGELEREIQLYLTPEQVRLLASGMQILVPIRSFRDRLPIVLAITLNDQMFLPSGSTAQSILGKSSSEFGIGIFGRREHSDKGFHLSYSLDYLAVGNSQNDLVVVSPLVLLEYRFPLAKHLSTYADAYVGPAYMDYSYNLPSGGHFGAKRFGGDSGIEVGIRYRSVQLSAAYRFLTEPSGVNFNGLQLAATWTLFRF